MTAKPPVTQADPIETAFDIVADLPLQSLEDDPYQFYGTRAAESGCVRRCHPTTSRLTMGAYCGSSKAMMLPTT